MNDTAEGAMAVLNDMADERLLVAIRNGLTARTLLWAPDPSVVGVWGLFEANAFEPWQPVLIVYINDQDFEGGEDLVYPDQRRTP